jgi:phosphoribosylglycinamide formyltransferase-1
MSSAAKIFRIAVLISGRGSNMAALIAAAQSGKIPDAEITVVISDQTSATGLQTAKDCGIETLVLERRGRRREEHDREIITALRERQIDLICLAGYMRILSREFIEVFRGRILNIHPSLLPSFPGLEAQKQALDQHVKSRRMHGSLCRRDTRRWSDHRAARSSRPRRRYRRKFIGADTRT